MITSKDSLWAVGVIHLQTSIFTRAVETLMYVASYIFCFEKWNFSNNYQQTCKHFHFLTLTSEGSIYLETNMFTSPSYQVGCCSASDKNSFPYIQHWGRTWIYPIHYLPTDQRFLTLVFPALHIISRLLFEILFWSKISQYCILKSSLIKLLQNRCT